MKDKEVIDILRTIAPGTDFREGLENVLKAKTGGLIVVGDSKEVLELMDGGFQLNHEYTTSLLYELAKMDGAIVISEDFKNILFISTGALLSPTSSFQGESIPGVAHLINIKK